MLSSGLDQSLALTQVELKLLDRVDTVIEAAVKEKDISSIVNLSKTVQRTGHACALAQAKLLFTWKKVFDEFDIGEDFVDFVSAEVGLSIQTVVKYTKVWEFIFANEDVPDNLKQRLLNQPMQTLILVAPAAQDDDLEAEDWLAIANAPDRATVNDLIREKRGDRSSSGLRLKIIWKRTGELVALKNEELINFGFLSPDVLDPVAKQAIERVIRTAGIVRQ